MLDSQPIVPAVLYRAQTLTSGQKAQARANIGLSESLVDFKDSVRAATTANITLSGAQTIDGVSVIAGDRVLVKDQSTGSQNGIYVAAAGAWSRATDSDGNSEVTAGMVVTVTEGTTHADTLWELTTNDPITVGSTSLTFAKFSGNVTSVFGRTGAVTAQAGDYSGDEIDETLAVSNYTPTANTVEGYLEGIDEALGSLPPGYDDDDVIAVLTDSLEDGYRLRWDVETDSLGTHFYPDVVMENEAESYASEIEIDLARDRGDRHTVTLTGNPTLLITNFSLGSDPERPGKLFRIVTTQDATGGRTIDFEGSSQTWIFPDGEPALSPIPGAIDELEFLVTSVDPPEFTFVRAIHRPRRVDLSGNPAGLGTDATHFYTFDEASSPAVDGIGSLDLTWTGSPSSGAGVVDDCLILDADDGALGNGPYEPISTTNLTVCGSVKLSATLATQRTLLLLYNSDSTLEIAVNSDNRFLAIMSSGGATTVTASTFGSIPADTWCFVAVRWNATTKTLRISVNGGTDNSTVGSGAYTDTGLLVVDFRGVIALTVSFDDWGIWRRELTDDEVDARSGGETLPFDGGDLATLNWRYELNYVTLETGDGTYTIQPGDVQPSQTIRVAVENDSATGTVDFSGVDFGDEGSPTLPGDGTFDLFELTAIDVNTISGRTIQTGLTP